jgi:hypothetical protein
MKVTFLIPLIIIFILASRSVHSQTVNTKSVTLALSGGKFSVGHNYITGIWTGIDVAKTLTKRFHTFPHRITVGGEIYFENGADKATIYNPTLAQFIGDRYFHESNTGISAKISVFPFGGFMKGFYISAAPLLVYSIRTYEKRAQLIQYPSNLFVRMSELGSDNKLLPGYRLTAGHDFNLKNHWLVGARADILQYHERDLNSVWGIKVGYRL